MDEKIATKTARLLDQDSSIRYRTGAITRLAAGAGSEIVHCSYSGSVGLLRSDLAALLGRCQSFKTLEEHARACCSGQGSGEELTQVHTRLKELAVAGLLISDRDVVETWERTARPPEKVTISSMCFPSCNRVDAMKRCLESYITNSQQHGKTTDFVVMDDSASREVRKAYRQMLGLLKSEHSADIKYAGWEEKQEFLRKLTATRDLPFDVVKLAFLGDEESGLSTYGANHNAILLHTTGDAIFCADDDTRCRIASAPIIDSGLVAVSDVYTPGVALEQVWFFPDRDTTLRSANFIDTSLLDMHERYLGMELGACVAAASRDSVVDLDRTDFHFHKMLASGQGRVRVTLNGVLGDCGYTRPSHYLFLNGPSLERLIRNESTYQAQCVSREFLRVVDRVTVSDSPPLQGTFLGLDNREVLPPYLPVGRGQDTLFGHVLSMCYHDNYYARLPWALLHEPVEKRCFSTGQIVERRPPIEVVSRLIGLLVGSLRIGRWTCDPKVRLRILGSYLEEIGRMPAFEFKELVCLQAWQLASSKLCFLESSLQQADESRQFWVRDVRSYTKSRREALIEEGACLPFDLREGHDFGRAMEISQQLVWQFGRLLQWWPDIVESARRLRAQGYTLAQAI